jgi:putative transcriptional regulator
LAAALLAPWLSFAAAPLMPGPGSHLTAIFIIARPEVADPNFGDAVVLVLNDLGPAPVGIIVNRPTRITVATLFPQLKALAKFPDKVYFGGPVEMDTLWFLFRAAQPPAHAVRAFGDIYLSARRDLLLQLLARDKPMDGLRVYLGHAGWAPGQLEAEIAHGDWQLEHVDAQRLFGHKSEHVWPTPERPTPEGSTPDEAHARGSGAPKTNS